MEKTFIINNTEYTITTCTAIATTAGDTERQDALLVVAAFPGETVRHVVYGYEMPEDEADYEAMSEDSSAWSADSDDLATVAFC